MNSISLQRGRELQLTHDISVIHPKLSDIEQYIYDNNLTISDYYKLLFTLIGTSKDVADILFVQNKIWYEDITNEWVFFIQKSISTKKYIDIYTKQTYKDRTYFERKKMLVISEDYKNALNFFLNLNGEYVLWQNENNKDELYLIYTQKDKENRYIIEDNSFKFTEAFYNLTTEYLKQIHWLNFKYDFLRGGTKSAKEYILKQEYKQRNKRKNSINLDTFISCVIAKTDDFEKVFNMPIYTFFDKYNRLVHIEEARKFSSALFNGCIDTKKNPVDWGKIDWNAVIR